MTGRFFSPLLLCAVMLLCVAPISVQGKLRTGLLVFSAVAIAAVGLLHPLSPLLSGEGYSRAIAPKLQYHDRNNGICDERSWYYPWNGLLRAWRHEKMPAYFLRAKGERLRDQNSGLSLSVYGVIGMYGAFAGPEHHIVDFYALSDPLLARLPVIREPPPRIGHMMRLVPRDHVRSLEEGANRFKDPALAKLYDAINRVHSGKIWDRQRWADIWALHTGKYDRAIDKSKFFYLPKVTARDTNK